MFTTSQQSVLLSAVLAGSAILTGLVSSPVGGAAAQDLDSGLRGQPLELLAQRAKVLGDPQRGALIFYRAQLACAQCHSVGEGPLQWGPDLSAMGARGTARHVVESMLDPGRQILPGYETVNVLLKSGKLLTGVLRAERPDSIVLFVPGEDAPRDIDRHDIENRFPGRPLMPSGLINQLADEHEFYDLAAFVLAVAEAGPATAAALKPPARLLEPAPLPDYEYQLDHAGLISAWDQSSLDRGAKLYRRSCANCHGTRSGPGSLPHALRFGAGKFRNGHDPFSIYQTITHGYRSMLPQRALTPREKYDVVHYLREHFLRIGDRSQYTRIDQAYLNGLPVGEMHGPEPTASAPWSEMNYGPFLIGTFEIPTAGIGARYDEYAEAARRPRRQRGGPDHNIARKGIAIGLAEQRAGVTQDRYWAVFDHETLRLAAVWSGEEFIDWEGILLNGRHRVSPRLGGQPQFANGAGPGWADPRTASFNDPRELGLDGRPYGPLPRDWARYLGLYKYGEQVVLSYRIGKAKVLETFGVELSDARPEVPIWTRTLNVGPESRALHLRVAPAGTCAVTALGVDAATLATVAGYHQLTIPARTEPIQIKLLMARTGGSQLREWARHSPPPRSLQELTKGGPAQWSVDLTTQPVWGDEPGAFAIDELTLPSNNPWRSRLRTSGLDFLSSGDGLAVCCCDGDVWIVTGIGQGSSRLHWRRIASGLFQPLGLKLVDGQIYVNCRDQIVRLHDFNNDGETDYYESFNNDHQVTPHFHEFAMGLQTDDDGNFYYAKSARHALGPVVPQHGTLLRVSSDGRSTEIIARGFRAANGVCLNPDGSFFVTDQEGHWTPMNRVNRVKPGGFYGNMFGHGAPHDASDRAMELPLCWADKKFDRSPAELLWVDSHRWGPFNGALLSLSYGFGNIYIVPHERSGPHWQGGMSRLPLPSLPTGLMRARFHPQDGQMYACGMTAWGSDQIARPGGLYRIRYTGRAAYVPRALHARRGGIKIEFSEPVEPGWASEPANYLIETWTLKRTAAYGSAHHHRRTLSVDAVTVSADLRSVALQIPEIRPTWCMQIGYRLKRADGTMFNGVIQNTIHRLGD